MSGSRSQDLARFQAGGQCGYPLDFTKSQEDGLAIQSTVGADNIPIPHTKPSEPETLPEGSATCAIFRAMQGLHSEEVSIALVGDKSEGLAGNNLLEIRARGVTRRLALAEFNLVDRRTGSLNTQAAVLIGLANGQTLQRIKESMSATMRRLRTVLKEQLGLSDDPFLPYEKATGWKARFQLSDQRGRSDQRAQVAAEKRTVSYDQLRESGIQFEAVSELDNDLVEDAADEWLRSHDPQFRG